MAQNEILTPTLKDIHKTLITHERHLSDIYNHIISLQEQGGSYFETKALTNGGQPYEVNYWGKKHLYVWSNSAVTLTSSDYGSLPIPASAWTPVEFPESTRLQMSTTGTFPLVFKATNEVLLGAVTVPVNIASGQGVNVNNLPSTVNSFSLFASQAFPVGTTNSGIQGASTGFRGVIVYLNVTAIGTGTIQLVVQGEDTTATQFYTILQDAFAITANGFYTFIIYPGITVITSTSGTVPGSGAVRTAVNSILPGSWRVQLIVATAPVTASVNVAQQV